MVVRIMIGIGGCFAVSYVLKVIVPLWTIDSWAQDIYVLFEEIFNLLPEERERIFRTESLTPRTIRCGKTRIVFSNFEEACTEFESAINSYESYCKKYAWLLDPEPTPDLVRIKNQVAWMKTRA